MNVFYSIGENNSMTGFEISVFSFMCSYQKRDFEGALHLRRNISYYLTLHLLKMDGRLIVGKYFSLKISGNVRIALDS